MKRQKLFATRRWNVFVLAPRKLLLRRWLSTLAFIKGTDPGEFERTTSLLSSVLIMSAEYHRGFITPWGTFVSSAGFAGENHFGMGKRIWQASLLIHEIYHLRQFRSGWWRRLSQKRFEENAYWAQIYYLRKWGQYKMAERLEEQLSESDEWWNTDDSEVRKEWDELMDFYKRVARREFDIEYVSNKNFRS